MAKTKDKVSKPKKKYRYINPEKVDAETLITLMRGSGYADELTDEAEAIVCTWSHEEQSEVAEYVMAEHLICSDHNRIKLPPKPSCMNGIFT